MDFAGFAALAATVFGLVAVLVEIGRKNPSAFLEIATDSEGFARSVPPAAAAAHDVAENGFPQALAHSA